MGLGSAWGIEKSLASSLLGWTHNGRATLQDGFVIYAMLQLEDLIAINDLHASICCRLLWDIEREKVSCWRPYVPNRLACSQKKLLHLLYKVLLPEPVVRQAIHQWPLVVHPSSWECLSNNDKGLNPVRSGTCGRVWGNAYREMKKRAWSPSVYSYT
jgi:hypothetical protein